jgi:exodeoxyribonuclease VIII
MSADNCSIHYEMPEAEYRAANGIAASDIKHILPPRTPAHYASHMAGEVKKETTKAMLLGTLTHLAVLEPDKLDAAFAVRPPGMDYRTKAGKEWRDAQTAPVIDQEDADSLHGMRDAVAAHAGAQGALAETRREVALFAQHRTGLWIKGRIDILGADFVGDVKTTENADPESFARTCVNLNYAAQAGHYTQLARLNGREAKHFTFIAVERTAPFAIAVYRLDERALAWGLKQINDALQLIAECEDRGEWPGYGDSPMTLALPAWAYGKAVAA